MAVPLTRGAILSLPAEERSEGDLANVPAYAQVWAIGFMYAVESWPEDWQPPRDRETAEIAIQASLTGHLVFSTLHTNDAASAVTSPRSTSGAYRRPPLVGPSTELWWTR